MRQLIALRNRHRVFGRGEIQFLEPDNHHVLAFVRCLGGEQAMLCVANLSRLAQYVEVDLREFAGSVPVEVFGRNRFAPIGDAPYSLTLVPHGFFWFALDAVPSTEESAGIRPTDDAADVRSVPRMPGTWLEVLRRRASLGRTLARWLPARRWFAGKGATILEVAVEDVIALDDRPDRLVALALVRTAFTEGDDHRYAVPVLHTTESRAAELDQRHPGALIAFVDDGAIVDAMAAPEGAGAVAAAALRRRTRRGRSAVAVGHPRRTGLTRLADDPRDVHPLGVEQSNSSAILGGRVIAKLIRQLSPGANPDVTLPMHLRRAGFEHVPGVAGTLDVTVPDGTPTGGSRC